MNDGGGIEILGWYEYFCKSSGFGGLNNIDNAVNRAYFATERQFADKDFLTYIRGGVSCLLATRIEIVMGRSRDEPVLMRFAGARLTVVL